MARKLSPEADFDRRMLIMMGVGGTVFATLVARLSQLQFLEADYYQELAAENHIRLVLATPERGQILDRFGRPLASQRQAGRVGERRVGRGHGPMGTGSGTAAGGDASA